MVAANLDCLEFWPLVSLDGTERTMMTMLDDWWWLV